MPPIHLMNDPHDTILERYFWNHVDQGEAPAATPLFTGIHGGESLADVIRREFGLSHHQAIVAIESAQKEVEL
jgi:hypothetical protein